MAKFRETGDWPKGRVERFVHRSAVLEGNPWDDPVERELAVYLPHDYSDSSEPFAALWDLAAFTNSGPGHLNWRNQGENLPQRLDRLIGEGDMPSVVVPMPDCYTTLGGNQYVNSPSVGRYADYLNEELVPFLGENLNVVDSRDGRGAFGKSSGGYGAIYMAMHHPDTWGAAASHAGDAGFEWIFMPEFPTACRTLNGVKGDIGAFLEKFWTAKQPGGPDYATLMVLAMGASYDPSPGEPYGIRLPFDLHTMELDAEAWSKWLKFDPVVMIEDEACQDALRSLHGFYLDVGWRDQYNIHYGNRRLHRWLQELGIECHYEEFDGTHSGIDWRLDHSLPFLAKSLENGRG
jgi:enterochelin esterase-like enzyme